MRAITILTFDSQMCQDGQEHKKLGTQASVLTLKLKVPEHKVYNPSQRNITTKNGKALTTLFGYEVYTPKPNQTLNSTW